MSTDLEKRLQAALTARAEQVGPADLADRPLPAPQRRTRPATVWLAAAACLAVVGGGVAVAELGGDRAPVPAPALDEPEVVLPPDVGADWPGAPLDTYLADLDGDGADDEVRFRAEPGRGGNGRLRLESRLSGGGRAYGVVDLGSTLSLPAWQPVDLDDDEADEVVLGRERPDGFSVEALVLDLRDGVLVEAPAVEELLDGTPGGGGGAALLRGTAGPFPDADTPYRLEHDVDWWTDADGLHSSTSVRAFPAYDLDYFRPLTYVASSWSWRVGDDGLLRPEADEPICVSDAVVRRACEPGETDALPTRTPVDAPLAEDGDTFEITGIVSAGVAVSAGDDDTTVVEVDGPGVSFSTAQLLGAGTRVFTAPATSLVDDGVSLLLDTDADDQPDALLLGIPDRRGRVEVTVVDGPQTSAGAQTWLTAAGEVFVLQRSPDLGSGELGQWGLSEPGLFTVPIGEVCDLTDELDSGTRC